MIVAVEIIAAAQIAVVSLLALVLVVRRLVLAGREARRQALLAGYRDDVLAFVGLDDQDPPASLLALDRAEQREAVAELLARYTGAVKGEPRRRVAAFATSHGYVAAELRDLHARRVWRRGAAALTLGEFGAAAAVGELADALALDRSDEVRIAAARALGRIGEPVAAADLLAACGRSLPAGVAAQALLDLGHDALPWLLGALAAADRNVRRTACRVIGQVGAGDDADAVAALEVAAVADADREVRVAACAALGRIGGHEAALALAGAAADPDPAVRVAACDAITRLGAPESAPGVRRALDDDDPQVRRAASRAAVVLRLAADACDRRFLAEAEAELAWGWS